MFNRLRYLYLYIFVLLSGCSREPIGPLFVYKEGLYGLKDRNGKVVIEPKIAAIGDGPNRVSSGNQYYNEFYSWDNYEALQWMNVGGTRVSQKKGAASVYGGKWGLLKNLRKPGPGDQSFIENKFEAPAVFELILEPQFDWIGPFCEGLAAASLNGHWGFIKENGEWFIKPRFEDRGESPRLFSGWLRMSDTSRYVEPKELIEQTLPWLYCFRNGRVWVSKEGKYGIIDTTGNFVLEPRVDLIIQNYHADKEPIGRGKNNEECTWFRENGKFGLIDREGLIVFPAVVESIGDFKRFGENLLWIKHNNKYGLINSTGQVIIEPRFEDVVPRKGYAYVGKPFFLRDALAGGRLGKVDSTGKIVIDPATDSVRFSPVEFVGTGN